MMMKEKLLDKCKEKSETLYTIVVIALSTGARRGEILYYDGMTLI